MSRIIKNESQNDIILTDIGRVVLANSQIEIDDSNVIAFGKSNIMWQQISNGNLIYNDGSKNLDFVNSINHYFNYYQKFSYIDERPMFTDNRIPPGYSLYITGQSDNFTTGQNGGGTELVFNSSNKIKQFKMLNHYYAIGARAIWENCSLKNYFKCKLFAPATVGINQAGDFNKYSVGPFNMYIPAAPGTGAWDLDLDEKQTNTNVLKCIPVPVVGNTGFFDYDSSTNILTVNSNQTGGYNLYDADVDLHYFARNVWGRKGDGMASELDVSGLIGKMLFNFWVIEVEFCKLNSGIFVSEEAAIEFILGAKGNA